MKAIVQKHFISLSGIFDNGSFVLIWFLLSRLLQISSFNGKMNALNEVNKVIANVTYYTHKQSGLDEEEYLTAERMAVSKTTSSVG